MRTRGAFIKSGSRLFSSGVDQDTYLDDSLLVLVDHESRSVSVRLINPSIRQAASSTPSNVELAKQPVQEAVYQRQKLSDSIARITVTTKLQPYGGQSVMTLEFNAQTRIPLSLQLSVQLREPITQERLDEFTAQGIDTTGLVIRKGDISYFSRSQQMKTVFFDFDYAPKKKEEVPSWKQVLEFDVHNGEFVGIGVCRGYDINKTF